MYKRELFQLKKVMTTISASTLKNIADSYFKVIDSWKTGSVSDGSETTLGVAGTNNDTIKQKIIDELSSLNDRYFIVLSKDSTFYFILLDPISFSTTDYPFRSYIVGTYSSSTWTCLNESHDYYLVTEYDEESEEDILTGINLYREGTVMKSGSSIAQPSVVADYEFSFSNDIIATFNGTDNASSPFIWNKDRRDGLFSAIDQVGSVVVYNSDNTKFQGIDDDGKPKVDDDDNPIYEPYTFTNDGYKYDKLLNSDFGVDGHVKPTEGYITITGKINDGVSTDTNVYVTWFRKNGDNLYLGNGNTEDVSQKVTLGIDDLSQNNGQYTVTLPVYSGLYGEDYTVSMLYQQVEVTKFKTYVTSSGTMEDPRNFIYKDPTSLNESDIYVSRVSEDFVKIVSDYRKFFTGIQIPLNYGVIFYQLPVDAAETNSLVTLRVNHNSVDGTNNNSAMHFMWNGYKDTDNSLETKVRMLYSDDSYLEYNNTNKNFTPGNIEIKNEGITGDIAIQDLSLFNYQFIDASGNDRINNRTNEGKVNFTFDSDNKKNVSMVPFLYMESGLLLLKDCYSSEFKITSNTKTYDGLNLLKYNAVIDDDVSTDATSGLTFDGIGTTINSLNEYAIVVQLELDNIDKTEAKRYVLVYIKKDGSDFDVIHKWKDSTDPTTDPGEISCISTITGALNFVVVDNSKITMQTSMVARTVNAEIVYDTTDNNKDKAEYITDRLCAFENGIPRNAKATFSSNVETTDDFKNHYNCKIVALYGTVNDPAPSQTDTPFINVFIGNVDMRSIQADYSSSTNANYDNFKKKVDDYITNSSNEEKITSFSEAFDDITKSTQSVKAYYILVFIKYVFEYSMKVESVETTTAKMYHYYNSVLKYTPDKSSKDITNPNDSFYKKGTVERLIENDARSGFISMKYDYSGTKLIEFVNGSDGNVINFPEVGINTLDDIECENNLNALVAGNTLVDGINNIQDFILNNGCNIAQIDTYNGNSTKNTTIFALDFDSKDDRQPENVIAEKMIIKCIPVKNK